MIFHTPPYSPWLRSYCPLLLAIPSSLPNVSGFRTKEGRNGEQKGLVSSSAIIAVDGKGVEGLATVQRTRRARQEMLRRKVLADETATLHYTAFPECEVYLRFLSFTSSHVYEAFALWFQF